MQLGKNSATPPFRLSAMSLSITSSFVALHLWPMSLLPARLTQSSLGEKCAFYFDSLAGNVPVSLHSLGRRVSSNLHRLKSSPVFRPFAQSLDSLGLSEQDTLILSLVVCLLTVVIMSWRTPFSNFWRRSPYPNSSPPHVSDSDYSYLTPDDIVDPPSRGYNQPHAGTGDTEPDTLLLKHRKDNYRLQFPAYAIDDGALSVGLLRQRAAEATQTPNPGRIKLLYKGKLLDNDSLPCKAEGLKQHSEVLCVVSEVQPGESTPSDESDTGAEKTSGLDKSGSETGGRKGKSKKGNKKKNKKPKQQAPPLDPNTLAPPMSQRPSSSGRSSAPSPAPSLKNLPTALDQVNALASYFRTELLPFCDEYVAHPPTDPKARDFEHKKLGETVLTQVILKADGIEPSGDNEARDARRALIKQTQTTLSRLDQAANE